jgi:hypothetical protein
MDGGDIAAVGIGSVLTVWRLHMARDSSHDKSAKMSAKVEPERVGRMHARRREPSVCSQLARRLAGFKGRTRPAPATHSGWGTGQRVIVKTHVSRHRPGKARGSLTRHASYLGRDNASADGQPGVFYDATRDEVNAKAETAPWVDDRHHFRVIISPERGEDIPSMTGYVREVMARYEKDLDTKLSWVAINHHNTDNPHAHVVIRGRKQDGTDLVIPRDYISRRMRQRASEVATELLGERTEEQVRDARRKEVEAERFTSLDRTIERHIEGGRIDLSPSKQIGFGSDDRKLVLGRLAFLEKLELAAKDRGTTWRVDPELGQTMREWGKRTDLIAQLYSTLGNESGYVRRLGAAGVPRVPVIGVVVAKGNADEVSDDRFIVVRDTAGQTFYGRIPEGDDYRAVKIGSVAELGAGNQRRREAAAEIVVVAEAHGGVYSAEAHAKHLRAAQPGLAETQIAYGVRSASARLGFVAGHEGSGVKALDEGRFAVQTEAFERYGTRGSQRLDVRGTSHQTLAEQAGARAFTWLDRQVFGRAGDTRLTGHPAVEEAGQRRAEWLIANGYAERSKARAGVDHPGNDPGGIRLLPGAIHRLSQEERAAADRKLTERHGRPVVELPQGGSVTGTYQGVETLHGGKRAVVLTDEQVFVVPVRRGPNVGVETKVEVRRDAGRNVSIEAVAGASRGSGAQMDLNGLEAGR